MAVIQERMLVYYLQGKHEDAAVVALAALRQLGVRLPAQPGRRHLAAALLRTQLALGRQPLTRLEALPPMTDPTSQDLMEIMAAATISLASANPSLLMLMGLEMVRRTLQAGKHPFSAIGYALYGVLLCAATGQIEQGYALGQLALRQAADIEMKEYRVFVSYFVHAHISHWRDHIQQTLQPLRDLATTGEFEYLAVAAGLYPYFTWFIAELDLTASERAIADNMHLLAHFEGTPLYYRYQLGQQYYQNLLGLAEQPHELVGAVYDARRLLPLHLAENDQTTVFYVACHQLTLCYLFGAYGEAVAAATLATAQKDGGVGTPLLPVLAFYEALAYLALADTAESQPNWERRVKSNQRQLRRWAKHSPANCAHRVSLVAAEQARVAGQHGRARELYDTAVWQASEQDYLPELALSHEVTARYYLGRGQTAYASHHLQQAVRCYRRWGATGKLAQLEQLYPDLLSEIAAERGGDFANLSAYLDMASVLKVTQLLSSETALPALLDKLTRILIENAGAQAGGLFLPQGKQWVLASYQPEEMVARTAVALPFVWQVVHTQEPLHLNEEIRLNQPPAPPRALLCLPLLDQGDLVGVFYLEHQLSRHAFPAEHLPLLTALANQAAISLKNATLVAGLQKAQQNIQASEQRFRLLFDNAPLGILEVNIATTRPHIRAANHRAEAVYGWPAAEMAALSPGILVPAESRPAMQRLIETVRGGQPALTESIHQRRDGTQFPVRIMATPAPEPDGLHMIVAVEDITAEQKRRSELQAIEDERQRIAQEIHDGVAQDLAFLRLKFGLWRDWVESNPVQVQTELTQTQAVVDQTLEELRRAIYALRPLALESLGFLPALRRYIADFNNQQTVYVTLQVDVAPEQIPVDHELLLFRVVQEGLNNIAQHAQASLAWVVLGEAEGGGLVLTVRDNGRGFDAKTAEMPHNGHLGLIQMRERVAQAGGLLNITSQVGQGTEIRAMLADNK
ncbi:MAG: GAF domain-containing protein [Anaerolineales bacterium]|nr:GAF domain-containing protein [Anaerolineales bacterium]